MYPNCLKESRLVSLLPRYKSARKPSGTLTQITELRKSGYRQHTQHITFQHLNKRDNHGKDPPKHTPPRHLSERDNRVKAPRRDTPRPPVKRNTPLPNRGVSSSLLNPFERRAILNANAYTASGSKLPWVNWLLYRSA